MNSLEIIVIIITVISLILTGNKNNLTWFFTILANVIWLIIGLQRGIIVIMVSSSIYLLLSLRGAYLWIIKSNTARVMLIVLTLTVSNSVMLFAQSDKAIQGVREQCAAIDAFKSYSKVEIDVLDESSEGGVAVGYFDGSSLRKIIAEFYYETASETDEYYFSKGRLIFILARTSYYRYPINYKHEPIGEIDRVEVEKFYFKDNRMIRWIKSDDKIVSESSLEYQAQGREWLNESVKLTNLLERREI